MKSVTRLCRSADCGLSYLSDGIHVFDNAPFLQPSEMMFLMFYSQITKTKQFGILLQLHDAHTSSSNNFLPLMANPDAAPRFGFETSNVEIYICLT